METKTPIPSVFIFKRINYILMAAGVILIAIGFLLMTGSDANTQPDGVYNPHYWNEDIFSFRRIRLAPAVVLLGFVVEVVAILYHPKTK